MIINLDEHVFNTNAIIYVSPVYETTTYSGPTRIYKYWFKIEFKDREPLSISKNTEKTGPGGWAEIRKEVTDLKSTLVDKLLNPITNENKTSPQNS